MSHMTCLLIKQDKVKLSQQLEEQKSVEEGSHLPHIDQLVTLHDGTRVTLGDYLRLDQSYKKPK